MFMGSLGGKADQLGYVETDPSGRYGRFGDILGKGAMKIVYRGFDELLGIEVAWNQVNLGDVFHSPDQLQRLYSEVHLLKELDNDYIISFHHSWVDVNCRTFNFITELFTSGTLREYRQKYPRVDIKAVKNWCRQILSGLEYLHNHDPPVIHRDVKCDNIFVNGHMGKVKIGDLGLATLLHGSQHAHSVIGTPEFMAPELYEEEYNELVDIYSFGMCVIELFTSEFPYRECSNPAQIYKKVTSGKLPDAFYKIHDLEVQRFVVKCLANVSERLSAKELLLDPFITIDQLDSALPRKNNQLLDFTLDFAKEKPLISDQTNSTHMTITGTLNEEDDTIFLKVQIANKIGHKRNICFPFDTINDTAIEVANEMVKELEISDLEPLEIAEMIEEKISTMFSSSYNNSVHHCGKLYPFAQYYPQDDVFTNDDASSQRSINSFNCLNIHRNDLINEDEHGLSLVVGVERLSCTPRANKKCTRLCPQEKVDFTKQYCNMRIDSHAHSHGHYGWPRMRRVNSYVDVRRQQLQRSLMEEMHRKRMFKTVASIKNIGFQNP